MKSSSDVLVEHLDLECWKNHYLKKKRTGKQIWNVKKSLSNQTGKLIWNGKNGRTSATWGQQQCKNHIYDSRFNYWDSLSLLEHRRATRNLNGTKICNTSVVREGWCLQICQENSILFYSMPTLQKDSHGSIKLDAITFITFWRKMQDCCCSCLSLLYAEFSKLWLLWFTASGTPNMGLGLVSAPILTSLIALFAGCLVNLPIERP